MKLEISRMRVRLSELEKEQVFMKQGMMGGKPGNGGRTFLSSLSRGFGRIGIFGPAGGNRPKCGRKNQGSEDTNRRRRRHTVS